MADSKHTAVARALAPEAVPSTEPALQARAEGVWERARVAFIVYRDDLNVGGSLRVVETLAHALDPKRVEAHILFAYGGRGPVASHSSIACHFLGASGPRDFRAWQRARALTAELKPDILHFHNPAYWLHAALTGTKYKKLVHLHGPYFPSRMGLKGRWLMRRNSQLADAVVCISRDMRQMVIEQGWGKAEQTWTVHNGIDCQALRHGLRGRDARAALDLPADARILGVVCRLAWYKGCADAIRILERLPAEWHLLFCGDGPMKEYLIDMARRAGVEHRTHFSGMVDDMQVAYASMDAFLFLSKLEPFGLVIAEAMAARVPVFGLAAEGAYRDSLYPLITDKNSVFIERSSPGDYLSPEPGAVISELATHIADFGRNPERFQPMVDDAERWVRERCDAQVQAEAMVEVYDFVLGRPTDSPK